MGTRIVIVGAAACAVFLSLAQAQERGRLAGRVLDEAGHALAGAHVRFVPQGAGSPVELVSDKDGRVAAGYFPAGRFRVEVVGRTVRRVQALDRSAGQDKPADAPEFEVAEGHVVQVQIVAGAANAQEEARARVEAPATTPDLAPVVAAYREGDFARVLEEAAKVLQKQPDLGPAHFMRGVALWRTGHADEAVVALRRAAELVPDQPGLHGVLGAALLEVAGRTKTAAAYDAAIAELRLEVERGGRTPAALNNLVVALDKAGRPEEEAQTLRSLLEADPGNAKARRRLAQLLTDVRPAEALALLEAIEPPTDDAAADAYNALVVLFNRKEVDAVVAAGERWALRMPAQAYLHRVLGQAYLAAGRTSDAVRELRRFLELAPGAPEAAQDRGVVEALEKKR